MRAKRGHEPSPRLRLPMGLGSILLFALTLTSSPAWAQLQTGPWPKYRQNIGNTGLGVGSGSNGTLDWSLNSQSLQTVSAIATDGTLYVTGQYGGLTALSPIGVTLWTYSGYPIVSSATIGSDGTIYVINRVSVSPFTENLVALSPNGSTKWTLALGFNAALSPTIGSDGTIYIGFSTSAGVGEFEAVNPAGTVKWNEPTNNEYLGSAAIGPEGTIYVSDKNGANTSGDLYAFNFDGTIQWTNPVVGLSPAVGSDGTIYFTNKYGQLTAFNPDETTKWTFTPSSSNSPLNVIDNVPAIGPDGTIYALADGVDDNGAMTMVYAINPNGTLKFPSTITWPYTDDNFSPPVSDLAIAADGSVYVAAVTYEVEDIWVANIYAMNSLGGFEWTAPGGSAPVIDANGIVYTEGYGSQNDTPSGILYAYGPAPATSDPVSSVVFNPSTVLGGSSSTGTVTLTSPAPADGDKVTLQGSGPGTLSSTSVLVLAGQTTATFTVSTPFTSTIQTEAVTATSGGASVSANLTIDPPTITSIVLSPSAVTAGQASTATVTVSSGGPNLVVNLGSSNSAVASVPSTVTFANYNTTATFAVTTYGVVNQTSATITASNGVSSASAPITVNPATLYGVSVSPTTVIGGSSTPVNGTVSLYGLAPTAGDVVSLTSSNPTAVTVPTSITVPSGKDTVTFAVTTMAVSSTTSVTITASFGGTTKTTVLTVTPITISGLALNPSTIGGLGTSTGTVSLTAPAPTGGYAVNLTAGASGYVNMPLSVTVAAGATSATFTVTGVAQHGSTVNLGIIASHGTSSAEAILTIQGDLISAFTLKPASISGTGTTTGTVTLSSPAPTGGWFVKLTAGAPGYVSMPSSVTVPAGATSVSFTVTGTTPRTTTTALGIIASDGNSSKEAILTITVDTIIGISLSPSTIGGLDTSTATVTLSAPAPAGGWTVNLMPGASGFVSMPTTLTIPTGATSSSFTITGTGQRGATVNLGIIAGALNSSAEAILTIQGDVISAFSVKPASISGTGTTTGTVVLSTPAPNGGWTVSLTPGAPGYVSMPAKIYFPAGLVSISFTITGTAPRTTTTTLGIIASDGNSSKEAILTIAPTTIKGISLSPSTIGGLGTSVATVSLTAPAPAGGWQVNLLAGASGYVTIPSSITVPAGATSGTFTITGTKERSTTINLGIIAGDPNSSAEAILTIQGDLVTSLTLSPSSVAPGAGSTGTVTISTAAPPGGWIINLTVGAPAYVGVPATVTIPAGATSATFSITTKATDPSTQVLVIGSDGNSQASAKLTIT